MKIPAPKQALVGRFTDYHAFLVDLHMKLIDQHTASITGRIEEAMLPFRAARDVITSIPGIGIPTDVIIAEISGDISGFPPLGQLASWAGVCPAPDTTSPPAG